jgi:lysophospholipase L1-like esterase
MKSVFSSKPESYLRKRHKKSINISALKKIIFSLVTFIAFFVIVEAFLGAIDFSFQIPSGKDQNHWFELGFEQDPELPWSWIPSPDAKGSFGGIPYQFNAQGFRGGTAVNVHKPRDSIRIACMGDSCSLGWEVADDKTFCYQLSKMLQKTSFHPIETINAGVPGYTSFQGLHQLQNRILPFDPDFIILSYNWNDHTYAIHLHETFQVLMHRKFYGLPDKDLPGKTFQSQFHTLVAELRSYQLVDFVVWKLGPDQQEIPDEEADTEIVDLNSVPVRVSLQDYRSNLERMIDLARQHQVIPILMTQPSEPINSNNVFQELAKNLNYKPDSEKDWNDFQRAMRNRFEKKQWEYNQALRDVGVKKNVTLVDMVPIFDENPDSRELLLDPVHPSPKGHKLIAEELKKTIGRLVKEKGI